MPSPLKQQAVLSVSQLNGQVRQLLEAQIGEVWLQGEISNLAKPYSGHWYFSLKDNQSQVRCAMFKNQNRKVLFDLQDGQQVLVRAKISVYEPRGEYQLIAQSIQPEGDGAMQLAFEQLKMKLAAEGVFATQNKQELPALVHKLGVITSASGAAFHDITAVLSRLAPSIEVVLYPSQVQGEAAPAQLIEALNLANQRQEVDLLILGRGGGSIEDLWAFNHEALCRAVAASQLPVISAVGHEIDTTLCDFAADWRAPTPSAAAERVAYGVAKLKPGFSQLSHRLLQTIESRLTQAQQHHQQLKRRLELQSPELRLQFQQQRLDELSQKLTAIIDQRLKSHQHHLERLSSHLNFGRQEYRLADHQAKHQQLSLRLQQSHQHDMSQRRATLEQLAARLHALSPLATLGRGYACIRSEQGEWLSRAEQFAPEQAITIVLQDGERQARIKG